MKVGNYLIIPIKTFNEKIILILKYCIIFILGLADMDVSEFLSFKSFKPLQTYDTDFFLIPMALF